MFRRAVTRLDGKTLTIYGLAYELRTTLLIYLRGDNALSLMGSVEMTGRMFGYTDALMIKPQSLL